MHFGHFFRDQAKGNRLRWIKLFVVAETNRLQRVDRFAGFVFVPTRRDVGAAESPVPVYRDQVWVY
jgi:hypothetical protein